MKISFDFFKNKRIKISINRLKLISGEEEKTGSIGEALLRREAGKYGVAVKINRNDKGLKIQLFDKFLALKILLELTGPIDVYRSKQNGFFESIKDQEQVVSGNHLSQFLPTSQPVFLG